MNLKKTILLAVVILVIDQWSKIFIKTHFTYQEEIEVFSWFKIFFIENRGAAWGTQLSDFLPISERSAKFGLTLFRLFAIVGIAIWGYRSALKRAPSLLLIAIALIFSGALGNIIDSVFYGRLFTVSTPYSVANFAWDSSIGGYDNFFYGRVVDMLYFPLIDTTWPDWVPFLGSKPLRFFQPVFNIADSAISVGVFILLAFNKKVFPN